MKPCDKNDWNEDRDHLEQLLREGEELRLQGGVELLSLRIKSWSGSGVWPGREETQGQSQDVLDG